MQKFVGSFLSTVMEQCCMLGALQMEVLGSFQIKSKENIKAFFQPTYEIDFISYDVLSEEVPEVRSFCTMKYSLPIFPKKSPKLVSRLLMWISLQKL